MKKHTRHLDHHQRSHYDTITIGPEGKFNWARKLFNSQKGKLFNSQRGEVARQAKLILPTNPTNSKSKIRDRSGQPDNTQGMFLLFKVKRPVLKRSDVKSFHEETLRLQIDQGNLISRLDVISVQASFICVTTRVSMLSRLMIDQGNLSVTAQRCTHSDKNNMLLKKIMRLQDIQHRQ